MAITLEQMVERWSDPNARPLFRGRLIDDAGCCCAQGDVLRLRGWSDSRLRSAEQIEADRAVAEVLGISVGQSVLLRRVNDRFGGCPQDVLSHPEKILGDQAPRVLAFWRRLDAMTPQQWAATVTTGAATVTGATSMVPDMATWTTAMYAAMDAAKGAAMGATGYTSVRAGGIAAWATNEIQGAANLSEFHFLPLFGIPTPADLDG